MPVYRGSKFQPSFEKIGGLRALTSAPLMALTASASSGIQQAIASSLHLVDPVHGRGTKSRSPEYFLFCR